MFTTSSHKKLVLFLISLVVAINVMAQKNTPFDKDFFPSEQKTALKAAIKQIKEGDKFYEDKIPIYSKAIEFYLKANEFNPNNALLNY